MGNLWVYPLLLRPTIINLFSLQSIFLSQFKCIFLIFLSSNQYHAHSYGQRIHPESPHRYPQSPIYPCRPPRMPQAAQSVALHDKSRLQILRTRNNIPFGVRSGPGLLAVRPTSPAGPPIPLTTLIPTLYRLISIVPTIFIGALKVRQPDIAQCLRCGRAILGLYLEHGV